MAPVSVTSTGIARQTIDDPKLIDLISRLSAFDVGRRGRDDDTYAAAPDDEMMVDDDNTAAAMDLDNAGGDGGGTVDDDGSPTPPSSPPLDLDGLVAELDRVPRWEFQEQADLYEWIRPLNAMDAALNYLMDAHPSLLLLPREDFTDNDDGDIVNYDVVDDNDNHDVPASDAAATRTVLSILRFQYQLLRNATSKNVYNSVRELSDLLCAADDDVVSAALGVLAALATPPMLHRQQAPEAGQHATALHRCVAVGSRGGRGDGEGRVEGDGTSACVMSRLMNLARGWGAKGSGLGLLSCVTMDDYSLAVASDDATMDERDLDIDGDNSSDDGFGMTTTTTASSDEGGVGDTKGKVGRRLRRNNWEERSFMKCAGEISFEYFYQPTNDDPVTPVAVDSGGDDIEEESKKTTATNRRNGRLISLYVPKEEMFVTQRSSSTSSSLSSSPSSSSTSSSTMKRRRVEMIRAPPLRAIKSTARLFRECVVKIREQLPVPLRAENDHHRPGRVTKGIHLPQERLFALLSSIRLARSFHSSTSRVAAVKRRLRALICVVHAYSDQDGICSYFVAQPELVGELVDLLRPTVSSGHFSATGVTTKASGPIGYCDPNGAGGGNILAALSDSPLVPYAVRTLAVEALTALVARRDVAHAASGNALSNVARQTNVLSELGVGKGQYLGLLPTLIRYSLAALHSFFLVLHDQEPKNDGRSDNVDGTRETAMMRSGDFGNGSDDDLMKIGLEVGLEFLRATKPPPLPLKERVERALEFTDSVLTLTSAVISVPSGTASLTDCGIIPSLVSTIALEGRMSRRSLSVQAQVQRGNSKDGTKLSPPLSYPFITALSDTAATIAVTNLFSNADEEESYSDCLLKFISAQAIQILEGAIVTHTSALSAFHELKGVDVLVERLSVEVDRVKQMVDNSIMQPGPSAPDTVSGGLVDGSGESKDNNGSNILSNNSTITSSTTITAATTGTIAPSRRRRNFQGARRALLFSAVNCLTVVFHQHDANSGNIPASSQNGAALLRQPELQNVLVEIMDNVDLYGGVLAALVATFLSDVMNSDPQVVHFVHNSGLAKSFLSLFVAVGGGDGVNNPILLPSAELIMALPNVIIALSLTEAGAKAVAEANPFPALLSIFYSPKYVMPQSRCLLNEVAAIIGTGLDEYMRHNPNLKSICLTALVDTMGEIVKIGKELIVDEENIDAIDPRSAILVSSRTHQMQYVFNIVQLLEQIFQGDDHLTSFVAAGGFDALLDLARWAVMPGGRSLVAQLSCVSIASATNYTTSNAIAVLVKSVCSSTDPSKLIKKIIGEIESQLEHHTNCVRDFTHVDSLVCDKLLESVPPVALYNLEETNENFHLLVRLSCLFRSVIHLSWLVNCLASSLRAACQRGNDLGAGLGREREWKKEIDSKSFEDLVSRISLLHRSTLFELCRIRTEEGFDSRVEVRSRASDRPLVYKIRIVCQEGAIIRNGIEIDRCESVGTVEMGEIIYAYDRCVNSSGVLRYQTNRGWISELTRGHGRENITEILDVTVGTGVRLDANSKRIENCPADLRSSGATILSRLHGSMLNLFSSFEKVILSGIRQPQRSLTFQQNVVASHIVSATKILSSNFRANFDYVNISCKTEFGGDKVDIEDTSLAEDAAICMYLGAQLNALHSSLCEDKREEHRRVFNVPLLVNLLVGDGWIDGVFAASAESIDESSTQPELQIMSAIKFVLMHSLRDMAVFAAKEGKHEQRMSRAVASSLPPTLSLLKRLISRPLLVESQIATALAKMKESDFAQLITNLPGNSALIAQFNPWKFARALHLTLAKITFDVWSDDRFAYVPCHVMHPWVQFISDVIRSLEEAGKIKNHAPTATASIASHTERLGLGEVMRGVQNPFIRSRHLASREESQEPFVASEESIAQLCEMGFGRDHAVEALENVRSNRVDVAMEYALHNPPSSPATLERTRAAREQLRLEQGRRNGAERQSLSHGQPNILVANEVSQESETPQPGNDENFKPKSSTADESNLIMQKDVEEKMAARASDLLKKALDSLTKISLDIIEGSSRGRAFSDSASKSLLLDKRGVVIVISNFLLDCAHMTPTLELSIGSEVLRRLKFCLEDPRRLSEGNIKPPSHCRVKSGCTSFAALLTLSVIIFRAVPKLRPLVLRNGIVGMITHCVRNCIPPLDQRSETDGSVSPIVWPKWLAPALLLLEVMSQPTSVTLDDEGGEEGKSPHKKSEYAKVLTEHKRQTQKQTQMLTNILLAVSNRDSGKTTPKKKKDAESSKKESYEKNSESTKCEEDKPKLNVQPSPLLNVPQLLPLLHSETQEASMILCLQLLGLRSKKGVIDKAHLERVCPPPEIVNAILVLLLRLLRSRHLASLCLQMAGAELMLCLPSRSLFPGNRLIISLILRRMLEDEVTLVQMMETDLRSLFATVLKKQHPHTAAQPNSSINLKSFLNAAAPLVCRDPALFVKAIASSVKITPPGSESSILSSSRGSQVTLLSGEERARNAKLLTSHFARHSFDAASMEKQDDQARRRSTIRSPKTPLARNNAKNLEPAHQVIVNLLLHRLIMQDLSPEELDEPFLSKVDYLDILSDLVLAIPACGIAIARYKPTETFHNVISNSPDPPQTAVSFILHKLLSQPRLNLDSRPTSKTGDKVLRLRAYRKTKISQASARLIVCLVARSGEVRRHVVEQLVFALSCGKLPCQEIKVLPPRSEFLNPNDDEMWAISSWGDLVAGLSSPRSSIDSLVANQDSNPSLSFPVIKLMLEHNISNALMVAVEKIGLHLNNPLASSVASSIIRPLEIYTREGVLTTVNEMQTREKEKLAKSSKNVTFGASQRSESDINDVASENEFHNNSTRGGGNSSDESEEHINAEDDDESIGEDSDDNSEIEVRLGNVDDSEESSDEVDEEEDFSSTSSDEGEEDEDEEDEDDEEEESERDDMDEDAEEAHYSDESDDELDEDTEEAEVDNFFFDANADNEGNNSLEQRAAGENQLLDESMMEGWTRVDNGSRAGLRRMLLNMVQPNNLGRQHHLANGEFLIDAAETMIGNILRGDLGLEGISAEIENSLGIVVRGDRRDGRVAALGLSAGLTNRTNLYGSTGSSGTTVGGGGGRPAVHQTGSSTLLFGNRGQVVEPMDVVFGGGNSATRSAPNEGDHDHYSSISVPCYDTNLFPGGVAAAASCIQSTQLSAGTGPLVHPLIQSVILPPATSINSITSTSELQEGSNPTLQRINGMPGSYIASANGSIIQVNNRLQPINASDQVSRRANPSPFSIWTDNGQTLDDFSATFGQALDSFLQDHQASVQEHEAHNNDPPQSHTDVSSSNGESSENAEDAVTSNYPSAAQELQSETADAGLVISQQASDCPPDPSIHPEDNTDAADDIMAEDHSAEESTAERAAEDEVIADAGAVADPCEPNQEEEGLVEDGSDERPTENITNNDGLMCPPDIDVEVWSSLPLDMQQELILQHEVNAQISESGLDPEALAALPEEMRREIIEQEQQQQRLRELQDSQADPANAEDYLSTNASFLASLNPDLRQEILLTADEAFISSLPPTLIAEANVLRERVASQHRQRTEEGNAVNAIVLGAAEGRPGVARQVQQPGTSRERRPRNGKLRVEKNTEWIENSTPLLTTQSTASFLSLLYLLVPIQPQRLLHKFILNLCLNERSRSLLLNVLLSLLNNDRKSALALLEKLDVGGKVNSLVAFPPCGLIGSTADITEDRSSRPITSSLRKSQQGNSAVIVAASLPTIACSSLHSHDSVPPVVARRIISCLMFCAKTSPRVAYSMLLKSEDGMDKNRTADTTCLDKLLDLLELNQYSESASNLEQLLGLLEIVAGPLSLLPKDNLVVEVAPSDSRPGKEIVIVPRTRVSKTRLHILISILSLDSCRDNSFLKISTLLRRLSRVEENRECILDELAMMAEILGKLAILDLKALSIILQRAAQCPGNDGSHLMQVDDDSPSSAVSLSTSNSETKLLRVLQMLHSLCTHDDDTKSEGSPEFDSLLQSINLGSLWDQLNICLKTVSILEGVANIGVAEIDADGDEEDIENDNNAETLRAKKPKQLQNSVAGLITRFLPAIEIFFMVNASYTSEDNEHGSSDEVVPDDKAHVVVQFVASNKILLNALLRSNSQLLEKGLRAMVQLRQARSYLDFDVKRVWFKTQLRRLRQQASRRHGSFRLSLRRKHVFEDSFHAFVHRNADELHRKLNVTFVGEDGVDAGGLTREFFAILAKEMFNPNYALFMSTEDGCTFQPNPNSSINPDDLRYFKFVGRIVGKAVIDGYLLDAHFTRSLYKHMLGIKPTHHDMQAIEPDYYKNLQMILEHNLEDIGLELTFSIEDHSFGRYERIDLIPGGRKIPVTEDNKEQYVDLVCQHRMTTAIAKQIQAFLEGFHEIVDKQLISIFNARELELLISGMPEIDIHDLKKNTDYNGYRPADKEIGWFWNILFALTRSEKAAFLQFVTGSSKVPLAGFSELQGMRGIQKFSINKANGPAGALMSAHTCFNALDLPVYNSEEEMKEKLLYAISEGSGGFGFA